MKYTKILIVLLAAVLFAACLCAPAAAWHSNTDAKVSPTGVLMPGDSVTADVTITYLRGTTVYRLPLSTSLSNQQWTGKLTRDDGTLITEFPAGKRFIDGYSITKLPYEAILTVHLEGTVPEGTVGQELTIMKVEEITSGSIVVSTYEKKAVIGSSSATATPTATSTASVTPTATQTTTTTATPTATATPKPTPSTATVIISSNPSGSDIFIDNNYKGFTPTTQTDVNPGMHTILLKKEGYLDDAQTMRFDAGVTYDMSFTLAPEAKASEVVIDLIKEHPTASLVVVLIFVVGVLILILLVRRR
ncbi:PEGA domain-containing protein [Methanorbis furvi]